MGTTQTTREEALATRLRSTFGSALESVTLYGSYARGTWREGASDINVLILLSTPAPELIRRLGTEHRSFLRRERITPLILTTREFLTSADVFPMEYADIAEAHRTIVGEDPTARLELENRNLRHQLEHQLRGSLVALRQMNLASRGIRGSRRAVRRELVQWHSSLAAVFRGLIRLAGESEIPRDPREVIAAVGRIHQLDVSPFQRCMDAEGIRTADPAALVDELDHRLSELAQKVDFLRGDRTA